MRNPDEEIMIATDAAGELLKNRKKVSVSDMKVKQRRGAEHNEKNGRQRRVQQEIK